MLLRDCFPGGASVTESACKCRRCQTCKRLGFDPYHQEVCLEEEMVTDSIFLPGEFHEQRSLADYSLWGCKESDPT